ncbi:MAG: hypothetical protein HZC29_08820 [Thaumarchaeota archaeon]|nr:hypothetical protein [Nitrososphaerota archaeon]
MKGTKSFIEKAFKNNDGSGTDFEIKGYVLEVLKKYKIYAKIPSQNEKYLGVRPDLIDENNKLVVEIHGSKYGNVHEKNRVQLQDDYKVDVYTKNGYSILIINFELLQFLEITLDQYIAPILMNLKHTNRLNVSF